MPSDARFEVVAKTQLGEDIQLGEADGLPGACQLIETVESGKYEPVEYTLRKLGVDDAT